MSIICEQLLNIEYGTPFSDLGLEPLRVISAMYYQVGSNEYVCASTWQEDPREVVFNGFAWVASDGVAEWVFMRNSLADDEASVRPPDCLLPEPGIYSYRAVVEYGKRVDPENFSEVVLGPCQVSFKDLTYYYRRAAPSESEYPIAIEVDLRGWKHMRVG